MTQRDADWLARHLRPSVIDGGYEIWRVLRTRPANTVELQHELSYRHMTQICCSIRWLREVAHAPLSRNLARQWELMDLTWVIPWDELTPEAKLRELERIVCPGPRTNLLECVQRLKRERAALARHLEMIA